MQINLSQEAINIILKELENSDSEITWELARLPLNKTDTDIYRYWKQRQDTIKSALSELRKVT